MPLYTDEDTELDALRERFSWFANVLAYEYGEADAPENIPDALNWVRMLPLELQLGLDDAECSLAYVSPSDNYACTVWDVSGPDDLPWCVVLADAAGPRLLTEYSLLSDDASDEELATALEKATREIPDRLEAGDFNRQAPAVAIPAWLSAPLPDA